MKRALLPALLALCGACASPVAPSPTLGEIDAVAPMPALVSVTPPRSLLAAPACVPAVMPPEGRALQAALREIFGIATDLGRRAKLPVWFAVQQANAGGAIVEGEVYTDRHAWRFKGGRIGWLLLYQTGPNGMRFPDADTLLQAMRASIPFEAEVRLDNHEIVATCQPRGKLFGRIEGTIHRERTLYALTALADTVVYLGDR